MDVGFTCPLVNYHTYEFALSIMRLFLSKLHKLHAPELQLPSQHSADPPCIALFPFMGTFIRFSLVLLQSPPSISAAVALFFVSPVHNLLPIYTFVHVAPPSSPMLIILYGFDLSMLRHFVHAERKRSRVRHVQYPILYSYCITWIHSHTVLVYFPFCSKPRFRAFALLHTWWRRLRTTLLNPFVSLKTCTKCAPHSIALQKQADVSVFVNII